MSNKSSMKPVAKAAGGVKSAPKTAPKPAAKPVSVSGPAMADEKRWKTEDAMRTIMRAEELKKDKSLMRDVSAMAKEQAAKLSGLCGKGK
ncbi:hypothetical protein DXM27_05155 [Rhizobium rhizogenes]|uniref:Uncharacterized protein n=1 Tax=Rhizobium rhizogenes TaxID=359 RepID=A0AA88F3M5_RHIRH|nr:hypothetical protein [Rhizobium rhizogenes]KAA3504603.1 hypothetical protein DXM27_05155 [Rhizobium rhizogenes]